MGSTDYWVYENWTHQRIRVHKADCPHCNDGRGHGLKSSGANDQWYGRFPTYQDAWRQVARLPSRRRDLDWDVADCAYCVYETLPINQTVARLP